jgi:tetratricopeptide (TPR) repeat protein
LGSILKALGLTIWGLVGFGLLVIFTFVGYQAALKFHSSGVWAVDSGAAIRQSNGRSMAPSASNVAAAPAAPMPREATSIPSEPLVDAAHQLFRSAAARHQHHLVIEYGQQLVDDGIATPDDMVSVAQSYSSIEDCANTRNWIEKANSAFRAEGREPVQALDQIVLSCQSARENSRLVANPAQKERAAKLLQSLTARAEADRRRLPQLEAEASAATSGNPSITLGELYYGFGEYSKAIESLNRGLAKGDVRHLDDAYVYLGLAERAVGDVDEARKAFARLKDVPGISPRVLRLWTLFAETQL